VRNTHYHLTFTKLRNVMTEERNHKTIEQAEQEGKYIRKVRSFVKREGRLTNGQAKALEEFWGVMGLSHSDGLINAEALFGNTNPVVLEILYWCRSA